jgi:hypothetical protein
MGSIDSSADPAAPFTIERLEFDIKTAARVRRRMRTPSLKTLLGVLIAAGLVVLPSTPATAAKVDFSEFGGTYRGVWSIFANSTSAATKITADVLVPKNGTKMIIVISGIVTVSSSTAVIQTTLHFSSTHRLRSDSLLMGFSGPVETLPVRFNGSKVFQFTQTAAPGAMLNASPIEGSIKYTLSFNNSRLEIHGTGTLDTGTSSAVTIVVSAKKKKKGN